MCLTDCDGHVGRNVDGLDGGYEKCSVGSKNLEGGTLLKFCQEKGKQGRRH